MRSKLFCRLTVKAIMYTILACLFYEFLAAFLLYVVTYTGSCTDSDNLYFKASNFVNLVFAATVEESNGVLFTVNLATYFLLLPFYFCFYVLGLTPGFFTNVVYNPIFLLTPHPKCLGFGDLGNYFLVGFYNHVIALTSLIKLIFTVVPSGELLGWVVSSWVLFF